MDMDSYERIHIMWSQDVDMDNSLRDAVEEWKNREG